MSSCHSQWQVEHHSQMANGMPLKNGKYAKNMSSCHSQWNVEHQSEMANKMSLKWQMGCHSKMVSMLIAWRKNRLPFLGDKQVALIGGQTGCLFRGQTGCPFSCFPWSVTYFMDLHCNCLHWEISSSESILFSSIQLHN